MRERLEIEKKGKILIGCKKKKTPTDIPFRFSSEAIMNTKTDILRHSIPARHHERRCIRIVERITLSLIPSRAASIKFDFNQKLKSPTDFDGMFGQSALCAQDGHVSE